MSEELKQESQKTVVAFVAGLLIGGLLVWVFAGSGKTESNDQDSNKQDFEINESVEDQAGDNNVVDLTDKKETKTDLEVGNASIKVSNQEAGNSVVIDAATFPVAEGWIAVRSYANGELGSILGAARFSKEQGLIPERIPLLAATTPGRSYAVVFFSDDGDREFNLAGDVQLDGGLGSFTAK